MNLAQAIEHATALALPGFFSDDVTLTADRERNEEAISLLLAAWKDAPAGAEPVPFRAILDLADRNRETCDEFGAARLRDIRGTSLSRGLTESDLVRGVAALQRRNYEDVAREAGAGAKDLASAYVNAPVSGTVVGIDIETTDRYPRPRLYPQRGPAGHAPGSRHHLQRGLRRLLRRARHVQRAGHSSERHPSYRVG